ncbi:hypothetical protein JTE90_001022, partial [Oedothorax gibbosus]
DLPSTSAPAPPKVMSPPATPTFAQVCPNCPQTFTRKDMLLRHMKSHNSSDHTCPKTFARGDTLNRHLATHDKPVSASITRPLPPASGTKRRRADKVSDVFTTRTTRLTEDAAEDLLLFMEEARPQITAALEEDLTAKGPIKCVISEKEQLALKLNEVKPMRITPFDEMIIRNATRSGICKKVLGTDRVRDEDHLTGWVMSQSVPVNNFEWMNDVDKITPTDIESWTDDGDEGYILEELIDGGG